MAFDTSKFKNYADLLAQIDAAHQAKLSANPSGSGDGYNSAEADNFSTMLNGQGFSAKYDTGTNHLQSLSSGMSKDPLNYALSQNPDGSIGQRSFSPASDYKLFGGSLAAMLGPLAAGGAFGAAGAGGFSNAALGLDAQGFALNPLAELGAVGGTSAAPIYGTVGAAGGAGATGLTAAQIAAGVSAAGAGASLLNGANNVPDTSNYSNEGNNYQNPGDTANSPINASAPPGSSGLPSWLNDLKDLVQGGSVVNGLLHPNGRQTGNLTNTTASQMDPRMQNMLYGDGTAANTGILGRILSEGSMQQKAGTAQFGQGIDNYLGQDGLGNFVASQQRAQALQGSNINAPGMNAAQIANTPGMQSATMNSAWNIPAASMNSAHINAPGQNSGNLSPAYNDFIYGQAGNNPYLTGAIQKGINQSTNAFQAQQLDSTRNFSENVLGNLRGGAQMAGQYGGSREGLAEGIAARNFGTEQSRALSQYGQNNTDAAVSAQAGAYSDDRNRSLSATQGLGAQQYGLATNNAGFQQQTNSTNAGFAQQANLANQANQQQTNVLNSGYQQQANSTNYGGQLQTNMGNAGFQQQANQSNLQSQLDTNKLNSINQIAGVGASSGLLNQANGYGQANNSYGLDRAKSTAGGLGPFTGLNGTTTDSRPLYTNPAGNFASAATGLSGLLNTGSSLYNSGSSIFSGLSKLFG